MIAVCGVVIFSDEQWSVLESLLPVAGVHRMSAGRRRLVDGVRWRVRTGAPWRDLPSEYGPWQTVYGLLRRWHLLRRHLNAIRSRWRILPPGKIAVIVLAVLRHDQRLADMAGGNNVSESTVRRWRD
ncbi:transposase [Streptomyces griseoaurantiacus]|uniref:transposase n=2 Tax=Streptomyces TaxID=1883 RepID=UPI0036E7431B